jgi:hypothetical protein
MQSSCRKNNIQSILYVLTFFIPLNDCIKSGNIVNLGFNFFNRFSTQFPNII